jgi:hypothetical protein
MDPAHRAQLIARYRAGADAVDAALAGAGDADLDAVPKDGGWSPRMVVHHLADSESNSYLRVRKLLAEDDPVVQGYDEEEYARRLHYDRPVDGRLARDLRGPRVRPRGTDPARSRRRLAPTS